jgi:hypothetical protein
MRMDTEGFTLSRLENLYFELPLAHGGPGKGKTMIALHVTDDLIEYSKDTSATVLYFFCSHQHNDWNEASAVLRRLLLKQHPHPRDYLVGCRDLFHLIPAGRFSNT